MIANPKSDDPQQSQQINQPQNTKALIEWTTNTTDKQIEYVVKLVDPVSNDQVSNESPTMETSAQVEIPDPCKIYMIHVQATNQYRSSTQSNPIPYVHNASESVSITT